MHFAEWVKMARESQGLLMQECAERAGVSQAAWSQYEDETRYQQPRQTTVRKIAHALRVSEEEALKAAGYAAESEVPMEWAALWHRTPADRRARLMKATRGVQEAIASY